jgi:hypothetical protein
VRITHHSAIMHSQSYNPRQKEGGEIRVCEKRKKDMWRVAQQNLGKFSWKFSHRAARAGQFYLRIKQNFAFEFCLYWILAFRFFFLFFESRGFLLSLAVAAQAVAINHYLSRVMLLF